MESEKVLSEAEIEERQKQWAEQRPQFLARDYYPGRDIDVYPRNPLPLDNYLTDSPRWIGTGVRARYRQSGHLNWCLDKNPVIPDNQRPKKTITLGEKLKGDIGRANTHVWTVNSSPDGKRMIAKFFDPLYTLSTTTDPTTWPEISASREYWCYHRLEAHWGTLVPKFYGLFLARLPFPLEDPSNSFFPRNVFVILIELIPGRDLNHVETKNLSPETRKTVRIAALELATFTQSLGVRQQDFAPRNFILRNESSLGISPPVLTMVDFQIALPFEEPWVDWDPTDEGQAERMLMCEELESSLYNQIAPAWKRDGWFD